MFQRHTQLLVLLAVAASLCPLAESSASTPAEQVSRLRTEVDELAHRLGTQRRSAQDELSALASERTELERQIRLEKVRANTLAQIESERVKQTEGHEGRVQSALRTIRKSLQEARAYVSRTLPFKRDERLRVLERIETDIAVTHPDVAQALSRLWRFVEEEESLAREVSLSQQGILLGNERQLVDVAQIGMALLYFRTREQTFGWARQTGDTWTFERLSDSDFVQVVQNLFAAFERNRVLGPQHLLIPEEAP